MFNASVLVILAQARRLSPSGFARIAPRAHEQVPAA
jgi:hypothetical protein